jgi:hypothetical protein
MKVFSRLSAVSRISFALFLPPAIGGGITACAILPSPDITVRTLQAGSVTVDSTGVAFNLRSAVTDANHPDLCMILDTLRYDFRPRAEKFHPLPLTDTTVYVRNASTLDAAPIVLQGVLEGSGGEYVDSDGGGYSPATGMDTPFNRKHLLGEGGEVVCLDWSALRPGVTYTKLRLRSTRAIIVNELTWHYLSRI